MVDLHILAESLESVSLRGPPNGLDLLNIESIWLICIFLVKSLESASLRASNWKNCFKFGWVFQLLLLFRDQVMSFTLKDRYEILLSNCVLPA